MSRAGLASKVGEYIWFNGGLNHCTVLYVGQHFSCSATLLKLHHYYQARLVERVVKQHTSPLIHVKLPQYFHLKIEFHQD